MLLGTIGTAINLGLSVLRLLVMGLRTLDILYLESDPEAADTARLAALMPPDETQLLYSMCLHGRADLGLAPDEYAALTMVLLRLLAFKPAVAQKKTLTSPEPPLTRAQPATQATRIPDVSPCVAPVSNARPVASAAPPGQQLPVRRSGPATMADEDGEPVSDGVVAMQQAPATVATEVVAVPVRQQTESRSEAIAAQSSAVLTPTEEGDFWHATVQQLISAESVNAMVRELALQSQLVARDTDQWLLRVERESLNQPSARDRLATALQAHGFDVRLAVEIGRVTDSPVRRNSAASAERQFAAEKIILGDPFVQSMMRDFGAKIVPGSIKPL
jgi:DNA polymerase-3 subunit gamma/tau